MRTQRLALGTVPDLRAMHRLAPQRWPVLFESVSGGAHGRFDLLLHSTGEALRLRRDGRVQQGDGRIGEGRFLDALDALWRALPRDADTLAAADLPPDLPGFRGGFALLLGYELAAEIEPILRLPAAEGALPMVATMVRVSITSPVVVTSCVPVAEATPVPSLIWMPRFCSTSAA